MNGVDDYYTPHTSVPKKRHVALNALRVGLCALAAASLCASLIFITAASLTRHKRRRHHHSSHASHTSSAAASSTASSAAASSVTASSAAASSVAASSSAASSAAASSVAPPQTTLVTFASVVNPKDMYDPEKGIPKPTKDIPPGGLIDTFNPTLKTAEATVAPSIAQLAIQSRKNGPLMTRSDLASQFQAKNKMVNPRSANIDPKKLHSPNNKSNY